MCAHSYSSVEQRRRKSAMNSMERNFTEITLNDLLPSHDDVLLARRCRRRRRRNWNTEYCGDNNLVMGRRKFVSLEIIVLCFCSPDKNTNMLLNNISRDEMAQQGKNWEMNQWINIGVLSCHVANDKLINISCQPQKSKTLPKLCKAEKSKFIYGGDLMHAQPLKHILRHKLTAVKLLRALSSFPIAFASTSENICQ